MCRSPCGISTGHGHAVRPWSIFLPAALRNIVDRLRASTPERQTCLFLPPRGRIILLFFALSPLKLEHYGLPAFPALAILIAQYWRDCVQKDSSNRSGSSSPSARSSCPPCSWRHERSHSTVLSRQCSRPMYTPELQSGPGGLMYHPAAGRADPVVSKRWCGVVPRCSRDAVVCHTPIPAHRPRLLCGDGDPAARVIGQVYQLTAEFRSAAPLATHPGALHGDDLVVHEGPLENSAGLTFYPGGRSTWLMVNGEICISAHAFPRRRGSSWVERISRGSGRVANASWRDRSTGRRERPTPGSRHADTSSHRTRGRRWLFTIGQSRGGGVHASISRHRAHLERGTDARRAG